MLTKRFVDHLAALNPTHEKLTRAVSLRDFKPSRTVTHSGFPELRAVVEGGEIQLGALEEGGETIALGSYARIVGLSRQAVINDDLAAVDGIARGAAQQAVATSNALMWAVVRSGANADGPTLLDGAQFFSTSHGNKLPAAP